MIAILYFFSVLSTSVLAYVSVPESQKNIYDTINWYKIPQYNGSKEKGKFLMKEFFTVNALNNGNSSLMFWPTFMDYDEVNKFRFWADKNNHIISKID